VLGHPDDDDDDDVDDDDDLLNYSLWESAWSKKFYLNTFLSSIQYGLLRLLKSRIRLTTVIKITNTWALYWPTDR
jgi:hypothetical protein